MQVQNAKMLGERVDDFQDNWSRVLIVGDRPFLIPRNMSPRQASQCIQITSNGIVSNSPLIVDLHAVAKEKIPTFHNSVRIPTHIPTRVSNRFSFSAWPYVKCRLHEIIRGDVHLVGRWRESFRVGAKTHLLITT